MVTGSRDRVQQTCALLNGKRRGGDLWRGPDDQNGTWKVQWWSNREKAEKGKGDTYRSLMTMAAKGVCSVEMVN
eukprot:3977810-Heterocapsa_arctica.AAC.1